MLAIIAHNATLHKTPSSRLVFSVLEIGVDRNEFTPSSTSFPKIGQVATP